MPGQQLEESSLPFRSFSIVSDERPRTRLYAEPPGLLSPML